MYIYIYIYIYNVYIYIAKKLLQVKPPAEILAFGAYCSRAYKVFTTL